MLSTLLVVVTLGHADAPHVAFTPTDNPAACAARAEVIGGVLRDAGYRIAVQSCVETDLRVTPYDHRATAYPHAWRLTVPAAIDGATPPALQIEPLDSLSDCTPDEIPDETGAPAIWCAVSAQAPVTD